MPSPYNVLIFPAGETNAIEVQTALAAQVNIRLFGASSVERAGHHFFINYINTLPSIHDDNFVARFSQLLRDWHIDVVIPTHDTVVEYLVDHADKFPTKCLVPTPATAKICRDKRLTYHEFAGHSFVPKIYLSPDEIPNNLEHVFAKPARGQGGVGARRVSGDDARGKAIDWANEVVSEYLPGDELTVDCFTDRHGKLLGIFPRTRDRTLGGISVAGKAIKADGEIENIATVLNHGLQFVGMWYFQAKRSTNGPWRLLEVSARCSGSQCLTRARGVNLPLLSVYAAMGRDVAVEENPYQIRMDRVLANYYDIDYEYDTVYIDYDDTITSRTGVNVDIVRLLYQMKNEKKKIILMTRHAFDIRQSLAEKFLDIHLFDEIVHLQNGEPKAEYISPHHAIFIDNAYTERIAVRRFHGIPVFDVDTTEVLQKWRR